MDIRIIRRNRLRKYIDDNFNGVIERFAKHVQREPPYLHKLFSGGVNLGERLAREIERRCGLQKGWLDSVEANTPTRVIGRVPVISFEQAATFKEVGDELECLEWMEVPFVPTPSMYAVRQNSDAMGDEFPKGTILIIDAAAQEQSGDYVVATNSEAQGSIFRLFIKDEWDSYLVATNTKYPSIKIDDNIVITGVLKHDIKVRSW